MAQYKLYAGLNGGFGGATFQGIFEFKSESDAEAAAYQLAVEEYESYGGNHGLLDYEGAYDDLIESGMVDPNEMSEQELDDLVTNHYLEYMESWLEWRAVLDDDSNLGEDEDDYDYDDDDDDADCFTDD